jgi:hypothetical protein
MCPGSQLTETVRYGPRSMVWEPFLLAIGFGLAVSAGIYFAILWPQVEPLDDDELAAAEGAAAAGPAETGAGETEDDAVS